MRRFIIAQLVVTLITLTAFLSTYSLFRNYKDALPYAANAASMITLGGVAIGTMFVALSVPTSSSEMKTSHRKYQGDNTVFAAAACPAGAACFLTAGIATLMVEQLVTRETVQGIVFSIGAVIIASTGMFVSNFYTSATETSPVKAYLALLVQFLLTLTPMLWLML